MIYIYSLQKSSRHFIEQKTGNIKSVRLKCFLRLLCLIFISTILFLSLFFIFLLQTFADRPAQPAADLSLSSTAKCRIARDPCSIAVARVNTQRYF